MVRFTELKHLCENEAKKLGSEYQIYSDLVYNDLSHFKTAEFLESAFNEDHESSAHSSLIQEVSFELID